jgi:hypothetical protein
MQQSNPFHDILILVCLTKENIIVKLKDVVGIRPITFARLIDEVARGKTEVFGPHV